MPNRNIIMLATTKGRRVGGGWCFATGFILYSCNIGSSFRGALKWVVFCALLRTAEQPLVRQLPTTKRNFHRETIPTTWAIRVTYTILRHDYPVTLEAYKSSSAKSMKHLRNLVLRWGVNVSKRGVKLANKWRQASNFPVFVPEFAFRR